MAVSTWRAWVKVTSMLHPLNHGIALALGCGDPGLLGGVIFGVQRRGTIRGQDTQFQAQSGPASYRVLADLFSGLHYATSICRWVAIQAQPPCMASKICCVSASPTSPKMVKKLRCAGSTVVKSPASLKKYKMP